MGTLSNLMRWKSEYTLKSPDGKDLKKVYLRIIGDNDLQESYRLARIASAEKRDKLRDVDSNDFKDQVLSWKDATEDECKALIRAARENNWQTQAFSIVVRPDEVKLADIALDPDAPTLEEQEKLDAANIEVDVNYQKALEEFIETKRNELTDELSKLSIEELRLLAQAETVVVLPLTVFMNELLDQKVWRAVYEDKDMTEHGFISVEDYRSMLQPLRDQLAGAYLELEQGADDLKN